MILDHTLWDFEKNSALAFETILAKHDVAVDYVKFNEIYSVVNANYWKLYRDGNISQQELRYGRLRDTFDKLDCRIADDLLNAISDDYVCLLPQNSYLHDGAIEILEYLSLNKPAYYNEWLS